MIAQIGPVDREIFAKNGIFKFCLVPGGIGSNPRFLQDTRGTMARDIRYTVDPLYNHTLRDHQMV